MAADASIYSMIRPQQAPADPMAQYGQVMQMKTLMGQQGLQDLQRQQVERGMADDLKVRDLFSKGNVTPEQLMAIDPKTGMAYGKSQLENKKTQGEIDKNKAETLLKQSTYMRDRLAGVQDQNGYSAWIEEGKSIFGPDVVRSTPPQFSPEVKNALLMKAEDLIVPLAKKLELESAARGQNITMRGQDITAQTVREGHAVTRRGQNLTDQRSRDLAQATRDAASTGRIPQGYRQTPNGDLEAIPGGPADKKDDSIKRTLDMYVAARDGLMTGLEGSTTGAVAGRIPAMTTGQQVAEGGVAAMAPVLKQLFRVAGEGVFTDRDQLLLLDMVPKRTDNPEARQLKMDNIDAIVSAKMGGAVPKRVSKAPEVDASKLSDDEIRRELGI